MRVDRDDLAGSVAELVRIPSVNPLHAGPRAGVPGERALAEHVAARFDEVGASEVVLDHVVDGRPNVYGMFPGRTDRTVVLDVHLDTVSVEHMTEDPFDGRIEDGYVWGRGALDTKATMGVILSLLGAWKASDRRPDPTLVVVGSISEEGGGLLGATRFVEWAGEEGLAVNQLISAEPTDLAPVHGHKGGMGMRVTTLGRSAHTALPHLGLNAVYAMARVVAAIEAYDRALAEGSPDTPLGTGTVTVGLIEGGSGANVVPDRCSITLGRRLVPGEDPDVEFEVLSEMIASASDLPVEIEAVVPPNLGSKGSAAFYVPSDTPLVARLAALTGNRPKVAPFGTNALRYSRLTSELAVFGPGSIDEAHQATERVAVDDLVATASALSGWLEPS